MPKPFSLYNLLYKPADPFGTLTEVSRLLLFGFLLLLPSILARADDGQGPKQEKKLVDRLLRPDMSLQNSAQNKKFTADSSSVDKHAAVGTFYLEQKAKPRRYSGTRDFSARQFRSQSFSQLEPATSKHLSRQSADSEKKFEWVSNASRARSVRDAKKTAGSRDYAGNRPFLDQGKSQKSLNRKNPPLTIEQVRELLNKNK